MRIIIPFYPSIQQIRLQMDKLQSNIPLDPNPAQINKDEIQKQKKIQDCIN